MADVLGRPFTRHRCLAVSPPLRFLPQAGGLVGWLGRVGRCASSPTPADSEEVRCSGAMREDPRTLFLNLNGLRVLYANLHLWRMGMTDFIINFFSSRVLVVKARLL